jgi:hypothetical protein
VSKLIDLEYIFSLGSSAPHAPVMSIYVRLALVNLAGMRGEFTASGWHYIVSQQAIEVLKLSTS